MDLLSVIVGLMMGAILTLTFVVLKKDNKEEEEELTEEAANNLVNGELIPKKEYEDLQNRYDKLQLQVDQLTHNLATNGGDVEAIKNDITNKDTAIIDLQQQKKDNRLQLRQMKELVDQKNQEIKDLKIYAHDIENLVHDFLVKFNQLLS